MNQNNITNSITGLLDESILNLSSGSHLTLIDIIIALTVSLFCSVIIVNIYKYCYNGVLQQQSFHWAIILSSLVTTSIIMVISGNLILSLGMVGALSIVRFRAAIKDPLDIVFLFWAITIGISNGVAHFKVSFITTIMISVIMVFASRVKSLPSTFLFIIKYNDIPEADILKIIKMNTSKCLLKSKSMKNGMVEAIYQIRVKNEDTLISNIHQLSNIQDATLISYNSSSI